MVVRYERKREFKVWEQDGIWYGTDVKNVSRGRLLVPYKDCIRAGSKDEIVDKIEVKCKFDDLVGTGMNRAEAARVALFGE